MMKRGGRVIPVLEDPYSNEKWPYCTPEQLELLDTYMDRSVLRALKNSKPGEETGIVFDIAEILQVLQSESADVYVLALWNDSMLMRQLRLLVAVKNVPLIPINKKINSKLLEHVGDSYADVLLLKKTASLDQSLANLLDSIEQPPTPFLEPVRYHPTTIS